MTPEATWKSEQPVSGSMQVSSAVFPARYLCTPSTSPELTSRCGPLLPLRWLIFFLFLSLLSLSLFSL
ncbi:MAG: hypothetical protein Q8P67_22910 [archaeon]|nr:hypothetical protein [archaeon]